MPVDPEMPARLARLAGVDADALPPAAERIASIARAFADVGIDSPAVQAAPMAIWATDLGGTVLSWNKLAEAVFGWSAAEVVGTPLPLLAGGDGRSPRLTLSRLLGAARARRPFEQRAFRRDGHALQLLLSPTLLTDAERPTGIVCFATDVTDARQATEALQLEHDRWRRLLANLADTVAILNRDGQVRELQSPNALVLGLDPESLVGADGFEQLDPSEIERAWPLWEQLLEDPGHEYRAVLRLRHADGHYERVECSAVNLLADPVIRGIVFTTRIVTAQKDHEDHVTREAAVLELIACDAPLPDTLAAIARIVDLRPDTRTAVLLLSADARELEVGSVGSVDPALLDIVRRLPLNPSLTRDRFDLRRPTIIPDFAEHTSTAEHATALAALGARGGWLIPVIENHSDELLGVIAVFTSATRAPDVHEKETGESASHLAAIAIERKRWQERLHHQARHHQLTGLPNRTSIMDHLDRALARTVAAGPGAPGVAVVFVDIDRFKAVNDSYGHAAGDKLLVRFAGRLRNLVRPGDFVGHFGADEFLLILEGIGGVDEARFVANRVDTALAEPFALDEGEVFLSASIGVALSSVDESGIEVIQHADAAMARAKELGRDRTEVFDDAMRERAAERLRLDRELRRALDDGELALYFQPTMDVRNGSVVGAEALLRWQHPTRGLLEPDRFLDVAEDTGLIVRIGRWVLDHAVDQARQWVDAHPDLDPFAVSVNVSSRQLSSPSFLGQVRRVLDDHDWPADQLVLELTEGVLIVEREATLDALHELRALGVHLALDDFGTGFSSLNFLHRFPVDIVKIDPVFVGSLAADGSGSPVVTAVLHMAHALGLLVVAEGVEQPEQLAGLVALQCDQAQGHLFARATTPEALTGYLTTTSPGDSRSERDRLPLARSNRRNVAARHDNQVVARP